MKTLLALALLLAHVATVAAAPPARPAFSLTETRDVVYDFARCVVKRRHDDAAEVVLAILRNETIIRKYERLLSGECLVKAAEEMTSQGVKMTLPGDLLHYALADALVASDLSTRVLSDLKTVSPLQHREMSLDDVAPKATKRVGRKRAEARERSRKMQIVAAYLSQYGECVVRADARNAHALLMTRPSSAHEVAAFRALGPAFNSCLESGRQLSINRVSLRGTVALNYYRLAHAPRNIQPGVAG